MKTLIYKINKVNQETGESTLIKKYDSQATAEIHFLSLEKELGFDYELSVGWEINGHSLGTTLLQWK